jgi:hypothetical protein
MPQCSHRWSLKWQLRERGMLRRICVANAVIRNCTDGQWQVPLTARATASLQEWVRTYAACLQCSSQIWVWLWWYPSTHVLIKTTMTILVDWIPSWPDLGELLFVSPTRFLFSGETCALVTPARGRTLRRATQDLWTGGRCSRQKALWAAMDTE